MHNYTASVNSIYLQYQSTCCTHLLTTSIHLQYPSYCIYISFELHISLSLFTHKNCLSFSLFLCPIISSLVLSLVFVNISFDAAPLGTLVDLQSPILLQKQLEYSRKFLWKLYAIVTVAQGVERKQNFLYLMLTFRL